jgi:hypothetical protein
MRESYPNIGFQQLDALSSLHVGVDHSLRQMKEDLNERYQRRGVEVSPLDSLAGAVRAAITGEVIRLLPGEYRLPNALTLDKEVTIEAIGRVRITCDGNAFNITGAYVTLRGLHFKQTGTTATETLDIQASHCSIEACTFEGAQQNAVLIDADYCRVMMCRFVDDISHGVFADIYYDDGADYGIAVGNKWSSTRTYVLSYMTGTNLSEAANGPAATIDVRP